MSMLMTVLLAMGCACLAAESLWDGSQGSLSVKLGNGLPGVSAKAVQDSLRVTGRSAGDSVSYICVQMEVKPFRIGDQALSFSVKSGFPEDTVGFYVRGLTSDNRRVLSYQRWGGLTTESRSYILVPGQSEIMKWEPQELSAPLDAEITRLWIYIGARGEGRQMDLTLGDLKLIPRPKGRVFWSDQGELIVDDSFELLGIGVKSAELRSLIAVRDANGHRMVLCRPQDHGPRGYLLLTDVETGKTTQYFNPAQVKQGDNFGSIFTSGGTFMYDQAGGHVLSFDLKTKTTTYLGRPDPELVAHFMVYTEALDGTVYLGGYPHASVTAYDPKTGKFRNYGPMDPREQYVNRIATDRNGYVYCGLGTARGNIVALNPVTGEKTQVIPEEARSLGSATVTAGEDGYVYAQFKGYRAQLLDGRVVSHKGMACRPRRLIAPKYGGRYLSFDDRSRVMDYDLYTRKMTIREADGRLRTLSFDYESGGLEFTSLGAGPDGKIYGSTCHPMYFVSYDPAAAKIVDLGPNPIVGGGNFCNITSDGKKVYACEYAGGRLWEYDPGLPIQYKARGGAGFGPTPAELSAVAKAENGHCSPLSSPVVLFCKGYKDGAQFTFTVKATETGRHYLNCQFLEYGSYGTIVVEFRGQTLERNLQRNEDRFTPVLQLGPVAMKAGESADVRIRVKANANPKSHSWLGLAGLMLSTKKLESPKASAIVENPRVLGRWGDLVTRPRAINVHPDGRHVVISGYANYGMTGGGFGIHDLSTGKNRDIADWLPGQSCICFRFLPNGDIIGGTSNDAPGGGYQKANAASLFRLAWKTGKVARQLPIPGVRNVISVEFWQGCLWAMLPNGRLLRCNPETLEILSETNLSGRGGVPRNALQKTADGRLFILQGNCISEIDSQSLKPQTRCIPSAAITAGGGVSGDYLYFACWNKLARYKLPGRQ